MRKDTWQLAATTLRKRAREHAGQPYGLRAPGPIGRGGVTVTLLHRPEGSEELTIACDGTRAPKRRTVRRWLELIWGDFRPWPPETWDVVGSSVRVTNEEPERSSDET